MDFSLLKTYYRLTKPGIVYGNAITVAGGFLLAAHSFIAIPTLIATVVGSGLIVASACVFNNYIDRDIDKKMARTKKRAIAHGDISGRNALIYGSVLGVIGVLLLLRYTNLLTVDIGLIGFFFYVVLYSIFKRRSEYGTIVGSVAGAVPPVAGYTALTNHFDLGALTLFIIMVCWQMPHFYAIALYRSEDYAAAGIPVLPLKKGSYATKLQMVFFVAAFVAANIALGVFGYTGLVYVIVMGLVGFGWLGMGLKGFWAKEEKVWAKQMFLSSLVVVMVFSVMLPLGGFLP